MLSTAQRWALQEQEPSRPGRQSTAPLAKTHLPFPPLPFRESQAPPPLPTRSVILFSCLAKSLAPLRLLSASFRSCGPAAARRPGLSRSLHAPFFPLAPNGRSCVPKPGLPRGLTRWGRSGFLLRASQEHYGRARSWLRPPAPASLVRSWDWRRPRGRERERGGTRPPVRAQTAAAAALAAMAERRAFAQKISR